MATADAGAAAWFSAEAHAALEEAERLRVLEDPIFLEVLEEMRRDEGTTAIPHSAGEDGEARYRRAKREQLETAPDERVFMPALNDGSGVWRRASTVDVSTLPSLKDASSLGTGTPPPPTRSGSISRSAAAFRSFKRMSLSSFESLSTRLSQPTKLPKDTPAERASSTTADQLFSGKPRQSPPLSTISLEDPVADNAETVVPVNVVLPISREEARVALKEVARCLLANRKALIQSIRAQSEFDRKAHKALRQGVVAENRCNELSVLGVLQESGLA